MTSEYISSPIKYHIIMVALFMYTESGTRDNKLCLQNRSSNNTTTSINCCVCENHILV